MAGSTSNEAPRNEQSPLAKYRLGRLIGAGGFARVAIAEHLLTGQKVAVKILSRAAMRKKRMTKKVEREIKIMRLLRHPHVIRFYDAFDTEEHTYIIMELAESGELYDYVSAGKLHEAEARRIFQQIISGVAYCHRNMVVHRDLKMENLLLDSENNIKIADFGFSNFFRYNQYLRKRCGSPHYAAPELIEGRPYLGPEVDVWSCGVTLYGLLCGFLPFDDPDKSALHTSISSGKFMLPAILSDQTKDLISSMLVVDPLERITITEVLEHPWLQLFLPLYLSMPPLDTMEQIKKIDDETVQEVVKMGFDKDCLVESLQRGVENEGTVVYNLVFDKRLDAPSRYLWMAGLDITATSLNHADAHNSGNTVDERLVRERTWRLRLEEHQELTTDITSGLRHKTRAHITELVEDTSKKLKTASEADHCVEVSKNIADANPAKDFTPAWKEFQKTLQIQTQREDSYPHFVSEGILPVRSEVFKDHLTECEMERATVAKVLKLCDRLTASWHET